MPIQQPSSRAEGTTAQAKEKDWAMTALLLQHLGSFREKKNNQTPVCSALGILLPGDKCFFFLLPASEENELQGKSYF